MPAPRTTLADQAAVRREAACNLPDRGRRIRQAVQAVETHAQVEFAVAERHLLNVGFGELNVVAADRGCLLPGARQHVRRDVCSDIADLLAPA